MTPDMTRHPCLELKYTTIYRCELCKAAFESKDDYWRHAELCTVENDELARSMVGRWVVHREEGMIHFGKVLPHRHYAMIEVVGPRYFDFPRNHVTEDAERVYSPGDVTVLETEEGLDAVWREIYDRYKEGVRVKVEGMIRRLEARR